MIRETLWGAMSVACAIGTFYLTVNLAGIALRPCPVEDDAGPCNWSAASRGNGQGQSFIVFYPNLVVVGE